MGLMGVFVDDLDIKEGVEGTKKPSAGLRHNARKTRIRLISLRCFCAFLVSFGGGKPSLHLFKLF